MFVQSNCGFVYISNNNWYWLINDLVACVHYFSPIICGIRFNALCIGSGLGSLYNSLRPSFLLEYWVKVPFKDEREIWISEIACNQNIYIKIPFNLLAF